MNRDTRDWRDAAACRDEDPDLFFPIGTTGPAMAQITEAKAVCASCPSAVACLRWALDTRQDYGVWGGATEEERRQMRRPAQEPEVVEPDAEVAA